MTITVDIRAANGASDLATSDALAASSPPSPRSMRPWALVGENRGRPRAGDELAREARTAALFAVEQVRSHIASWRRTLEPFIDTQSRVGSDAMRTRLSVDYGPMNVVTDFRARDEATSSATGAVTAAELLGPHLTHLLDDLALAGRAWAAAKEQAAVGNFTDAAAHAQEAERELVKALRHALYLTFLADAAGARVGDRGEVSVYCAGWGLSDEHIAEIWNWVSNDGLRLGDECLPLALDTEARCVYRKPKNRWGRMAAASAPIWGGALAVGAVAALFELLHQAGMWSWPAEAPGWKLVALALFVALGAVAHVGSRALNISYDSPIGVTAAGSIADWLALRWVGVLQAYVPVAAVVAGLWGAGNIPTSFKELGTALLAGYSADSLFRAGMDRLATQSQAKAGDVAEGAGGGAS